MLTSQIAMLAGFSSQGSPARRSYAGRKLLAIVLASFTFQPAQADWFRHACPAPGQMMARLELVFGLGLKGGGRVSEAAFRRFLSEEVTPRFPDGLTVLTGDGQWRGASGKIIREPSKILVIWYKPDGSNDSKIETIREAYKARFHQESVLRVDAEGCVRF